jgi:hypothetical protein
MATSPSLATGRPLPIRSLWTGNPFPGRAPRRRECCCITSPSANSSPAVIRRAGQRYSISCRRAAGSRLAGLTSTAPGCCCSRLRDLCDRLMHLIRSRTRVRGPHPRRLLSHVEREASQGIDLDGTPARSKACAATAPAEAQTGGIALVLKEADNREVRRLFQAVGHRSAAGAVVSLRAARAFARRSGARTVD